MFIEYQVRILKDGVTITQRVEPASPTPATIPAPVIAQNSLNASFEESKAAPPLQASHKSGGLTDPPPVGSLPDLGGSPVTIIGPFIFLSPNAAATPRENKDDE